MLIDVSYFMSGPRNIENVSVAEMPSPQSLAVNEVDISEEKEAPHSGYAVLCEKLCEPFADYVFYHILRDANTQATITGLVRLKCANEYIAPLKRQVSTWNSMVEKNKQFVEWAMSNDCPFDVKITKNLLTPINAFNL